MAKEMIMLDKERELRYPLWSLIRMEEEQGIKLTDLEDEEKAGSMKTILAVLWGGLIHEDKDLSIEELGNMVEISDMQDVSGSISRAIQKADKKALKK